MLSQTALSLDSDMLDEAKAYLRVENDEEDGPLAAILLAAISHAEAFTRSILIQRAMTETIPTASSWRRLRAAPVLAVTSVTGIPAEGARMPLAASAYAVEIDVHNSGHFRTLQPGGFGRVEIAYLAGLALTWAQLPESLRLGILRLVGHLYANRDAAGDAGPPEAVAALLRPWRRVALS